MTRLIDTRNPRVQGMVVGVVIALLLIAGVIALPQAPPSYKPSEVQLLRLQVKQRDGWLAQRDMIEAQRRYQQAVAALLAEGETVRKENGWPDALKFDPDKIEFAVPPVRTTPPIEEPGK